MKNPNIQNRKGLNSEFPLVSIIIPMRNEEKYIESCLKSILDNDYPKDRLEILVIDGMSEDNSKNIVQRFIKEHPNINIALFDNPKKIVPVAMNIGIRNAKGDIVIRMDAHAEYNRDYISKCVEYLKKTGADNVGGPMRAKGSTYFQQVVALATSSVFGVGNSRFHFENCEGYVDTVYLGAYRKEVFDKVGLFDEELVRNQDDEFNYRLIKNGGKIYLTPEIKSYYYPRSSLSKLWKQYFEYGYWKVRVIQKHRLPSSWRHLVPATFVLSLIGSGIGAIWSPWGLYTLGVIAGSYLTTSLMFSLIISVKKGWRYLPLLPVVFGTLHFGYGLGFLKGLWDFVILRKHLKHKIEDEELT